MNNSFSRLSALKFVTLSEPCHMQFRHWAKLYHARFPYQELAPLPAIAQSLTDGNSCLQGWVEREGKWGGFTLCEFYQEATLLAYLATHKHYEGQGLARQMVAHAIEQYLTESQPYFWLEASPKLWRFYQKLGFKRLAISYRIPEFYGEGSEKMGLFVKTYSEQSQLDKTIVEQFVSDVLLSGYELTTTDIRYQQQMAIIQNYPQSTIELL